MPMSPEYLPELMLLLAGVFAGAFAVRLLAARRFGHAMKAGAAGIACISLAFWLGNSDWVHSNYTGHMRPALRQRSLLALTPSAPDSIPVDSDGPPSVFLHLGGVRVRVVASDRYVLSADGEPFLTLDSLATGLRVTGRIAGREQGLRMRDYAWAASVSQNAVVSSSWGVRPERPDPHTFVVRDGNEEILRVRYATPRNIEIEGRLCVPGEGPSRIVTLVNGLRWPGGSIPSGSLVDLRLQGKGDLDFERSGLIAIVRESPEY